ncbi:MAG: hypothetical protein L3J98_13640 [Gammaproteobacteria bacterium]|nr:hypothetical protein [Gammaproteobacteria bacterium]MCF6261182.1 hypothetical protein [Gammaproteobacteria bacterium]
MKKLLFYGLLLASVPSNTVLALGNHPEAGSCSLSKPYFAICTHSLHNLEGWFSRSCYADRALAQHDAEKHAEKNHQGNMRWTGVSQFR